MSDSRGFLEVLIDDGGPLITLTGICLGLAGLFALLQSTSGHFLPHDVAYLEMTPEDLCGINECRIVHFMFHDRVSFGGALLSIAVFYLWLVAFPLKSRQPWAWWTLFGSGVCGFGSFLSYLGYGYLDSWHAVATVGLLPLFAWGLYVSFRRLLESGGTSLVSDQQRPWIYPHGISRWCSFAGAGRACLLVAAVGMISAGLTILCIGVTAVFVPTDLTFMAITREELHAINPRLIPLIAHDRAGFGGAVATIGILTFSCMWHDGTSRSLQQASWLAGLLGWTTAIGIHPVIGYTDPVHLAPAVIGAILYFTGLFMTCLTTKWE